MNRLLAGGFVLLLGSLISTAFANTTPRSTLSESDKAILASTDWNAVREDAANLLSQYLRIPSVTGKEKDAGEFFARVAAERGFKVERYDTDTGRPNVLAVFGGEGPLDLILLSHLDVVPASDEGWKHGPFSGDRAEGAVWGRGAIDTKGLAVMHLLAVERLAKADPKFPHRIGVLAVAGEEVDGAGAEWMLAHAKERLGKAVVLAEGGMGFGGSAPVPAGMTIWPIATAEKSSLWLKLVVNLPATGHGSSPPREYATRQMVMALNRLVSSDLPTRITPELKEMLKSLAKFESFPNSLVMKLSNWPFFRSLVSRGLRGNNFMSAMTHDTATLTGLISDTLATNAIPARVEAQLDCRLLPGTTEQGFIAQLKKILAEPRMEIQVMNHSPMAISTTPDEVFTALCDAFSANDPKAIPTRFLFPASSDGNAFRGQGHNVFGIIPARFEQSEIDGVHAKNEAIREVSLEQGIRHTLETCLRLRGWAGPK